MVTQVQVGSLATPLVFDSHEYPDTVEGASRHYDAYEPEVVSAIEKFVRPGDCCVDAGAGVGFHTCLMSKLAGPDGLVLAFEPHGESYRHLVRHVHVSNKLNNVACLRYALWKSDCDGLKLWSLPEIGYSSFHRYRHHSGSENAEGRKLDTLLAGQNQPRLIKMDCEGTEAEVIIGAQETLERGVDAVVMEFNYHMLEDSGRSDMVIRQYMRSIGYEMFLINIGDGTGKLFPPMRVEADMPIKVEGCGHFINVLFSTVEKVRERWKE